MSKTSLQTDFGDPFRPPQTKKENSQVDGACFSRAPRSEEDEVYLKPLERVSKEYVYKTKKNIKGKLGLVMIFNHSKINETDKIITEMKTTFKDVQFKVDQYNDLSKAQIQSEMKKVCSTDKQYACFICIVKTKGKEDELQANDGWYNADQLWNPFLENVNSIWHGKPKIFILEAERGTKVDQGIRLEKISDVTDAKPIEVRKEYRIPLHADFLFVYSTFYGHISHKDHNGVSIFLKELCDVIRKHAKDTDFESMLTIVKYKLAHNHMMTRNDTSELYKQMPCTFSTLTKMLYFTSLDNVVMTDNETDSIVSKDQQDDEQVGIDQHPRFTIEGTLDGFDAKKLNMSITMSPK